MYLNYRPYWLYFPETRTTPLYDSTRFIRQAEPGEWDPVFEHVDAVLGQISKAKTKAFDTEKEFKAKDVLKIIDKELDQRGL